ncbi:MAG TPA: hypothetical protein VMZ71_07350 [Gemmataceae bacterium]|nr:hypothetical protein [Gemmataceae bacterium]
MWWKLSGNRTTATTELEAAEATLRRNDPVAARTRLDLILTATPDNPQALLLAAKAARRCDDYAAGERHLTAFERTAGASDASRLEWTLLGVQQADFGDDEERLRVMLGRQHPDESGILEALAKGLAAAHRWPEVMAVLDRLLKRDPDHVPGLVSRAVVAERFRRHEAAEEDLRQAVGVAPENALAHAALAGHLNHRGLTREAIHHYERALQLRPTDHGARIGFARALTDAAKLTDADRHLTTSTDDPACLVERGRVLLRLNRTADAEVQLEKATRVAPWHRDAHKLRLLAAKELRRAEVVKQCEAKIAELTLEDAVLGKLTLKARDTPGDAAVRMTLWEWAKRNGQPEEEVAWLAEILRDSPKHPAAHAAFADYFDRTGQPRRAALHRAAAQE